jgi:DNA-binding response OmpR family regulator
MKKPRSAKILIIDDEQSIIDATQMMLEFEGYEVISESDNHSLEKIILQQPDLIFLDLWLTRVDGREFCRSLKKNPLTKNIPVLLCSASRSIEQNAREAQADDYIAKPFDMDVFLDKIKNLLARDKTN